jgi:TolB-like protein/AraC-like DNA-binding protein/Tfp pilus assembly protein PilF
MSLKSSEKDRLLSRLTEIIVDNLSNDQFGVNELAREMGMSRSNLHRKVKSATGASISRFISGVRLKKAKELLQQSTSTISEIAYETGFHSVTYFTKCFKDHFAYPPGEIRKGENVETGSEELQTVPKRTVFLGKRISLTLLISIIVVFISAFILKTIFKPFGSKDQALDKSIAVLPFINDSPDQERMYFINGTMEAILNNLSKIKDLRVVSRTSVEQYRENPKPMAVIAEEMKVSYVLEGSGIRHEDQLFLTIQLIDALNDKHLWSESYQKEIGETTELFSQVALSIAAEINVHISPEEKSLIEKIPTNNRAAYELYLRALDGLYYSSGRRKLNRSLDLLRQSLEYDPGFADAYAELGWIFDALHDRNPVEYSSYPDSVLLYANKALLLDEQVELAHEIKGAYYKDMGDLSRALEHYSDALRVNPNSHTAHWGMGWAYFTQNNFIPSIESFHKTTQLNRGEHLPWALRNLGMAYNAAGFPDKYKEILGDVLAIDGDSVFFYNQYSFAESTMGNLSEALEAAQKAYEYNQGSWSSTLEHLTMCHMNLGQDDKALEYCILFLDGMEAQNQFTPYIMPDFINILLHSGDSARANHYLDRLINYNQVASTGQTLNSLTIEAHISAIMGEHEKTLDYLALIAQQERLFVWVNKWRTSSVFSEINTDPEFLRIIGEIERKFDSQREDDRQWLEENDLL